MSNIKNYICLLITFTIMSCGLIEEGLTDRVESQKVDRTTYNNSKYDIMKLSSKSLKYQTTSFEFDRILNYSYTQTSLKYDVYHIESSSVIKDQSLDLLARLGNRFSMYSISGDGGCLVSGLKFFEDEKVAIRYSDNSGSLGILTYELGNGTIQNEVIFDSTWSLFDLLDRNAIFYKVLSDSNYQLVSWNFVDGEKDTLQYPYIFKNKSENTSFILLDGYLTVPISLGLMYLSPPLTGENQSLLYFLNGNKEPVLTPFSLLNSYADFNIFEIKKNDLFLVANSSYEKSHLTSDHREIFEDNSLILALINNEGKVIKEHIYEFTTTEQMYIGGLKTKAALFFNNTYICLGTNSSKNIWMKVFDQNFDLIEDAVFDVEGGDIMHLCIVENELIISNFFYETKNLTTYKLQNKKEKI